MAEILLASAYTSGGDNRWVGKNGVMHANGKDETSSSIPINAHQYTFASKDNLPLGTIIKVTNNDITLSDGSHPSTINLKTDTAGRRKIDLVDGVATHSLGIVSTRDAKGDISSVDNINGSNVEPKLTVEVIGQIKLDEKESAGKETSVSQFQNLSHSINTGQKSISELATIASFKPSDEFEKNKDTKLSSLADSSKVALHVDSANKPKYRNPGELTHQQRQKENENYIASLGDVSKNGEFDPAQSFVMAMIFMFLNLISPEFAQQFMGMMGGQQGGTPDYTPQSFGGPSRSALGGGAGVNGNLVTRTSGAYKGGQNADTSKNNDVINTLHPEIRASVREFVADLESQGMKTLVRQGDRSNEEQAVLLARGVTKAPPGYSFHNHGLACDILPIEGKYYSNLANEEYTEATRKIYRDTAKRHGFEWGGDWKFTDEAHIQMPSNSVSIGELIRAPKDAHGYAQIPESKLPTQFVAANKKASETVVAAQQVPADKVGDKAIQEAKLEPKQPAAKAKSSTGLPVGAKSGDIPTSIEDFEKGLGRSPKTGDIGTKYKGSENEAAFDSAQSFHAQYMAMIQEHEKKRQNEGTDKSAGYSPTKLAKQDGKSAAANLDPSKSHNPVNDLPKVNSATPAISLPA